jgi:two-component system nitrogen regulation sensor histidine kinase NtrY
MVFRHFQTQIILRVLALVATLATLVYLALQTNLYATSLLLALVSAYQIWSLINYVDRTNLNLSRFFDSVRYGDFIQTSSPGQLGGSFTDLSRAMNEVSSAFQAARAEKEEHHRYLQTVIQHVGVGVLAYSDSGEVELFNPAARRLLHTPQLRDIKSLAVLSEVLVNTLETIQPGQRALVKLQTDYESLQLSIHATKIRLGQRLLTLVSLQNIGGELAEQEMLAWQNLIRVLTHEIMNSMTPIASLAGSVNDRFRTRLNHSLQTPDPSAQDDREISEALVTIERRSQGLMHFVESYRDLTRIPHPDIRIMPVRDLVNRVEHLLESDLRKQQVALSVAIEPNDLTIACDQDLVEQVLINLINNALYAMREIADPSLEITSRLNREGQVVIEVSDNGRGIVPSAIDQIFIPFFTTKKGGTGIGLALSQQIMRLHRGQIGVRSTPNTRTVFTLTF